MENGKQKRFNYFGNKKRIIRFTIALQTESELQICIKVHFVLNIVCIGL